MILEIRLENFFSIKDEVLIDFRAGKINSGTSRELSTNVIDWKGEKILKTIGLFGPNASGKSNILKAINFCCLMVLESHLHNEGVVFNFTPFKFDGYAEKASTFAMDFVYDNVEYEYSFSLNRTKILSESLYYYPNGRRAKVFTRDESLGTTKSQKYSFADGVIPRPMDVAENTSAQSLFISRGSQMDRDICKKLYRFFMERFILGLVPLSSLTAEKLFTQNKDLIILALQTCDSDISDITAVKEKFKISPLQVPGIMPQQGAVPQEAEAIRFETTHKHSPSVRFNLELEESAGTAKLFNLLLLLLDVVREGKSFMVDEFDSSLHAKLADFIIDLFHASSNAQFLYTTHNTNLINVKRLRRDQVLFVNKTELGATEVYSLFDYKDFRENMDAEKGYLQGRFDAVPHIDASLGTLKKLLEP
jgi:uncharacterized protein